MTTTHSPVFGICCVCKQPCIKGQRLVAGARDCLIRHYDCQPLYPKRRKDDK